MLVLSRKTREAVLIGDDVRIEIIRIEGNKAVVGIRAPDGVRVLREELIEREQSCEAA